MAAPAVAAKVAVTLATDKDARKAVLWAILILIAMLVLPLLLVSGVLKEAAAVDYRDSRVIEAAGAMIGAGGLPAAAQLDSAMDALKKEYTAQGISCDFVKVQMFYLCTAYGREGGSPSFYEDFIACFTEGDDYRILENIESLLSVSYSAQEKAALIRLTEETVKTQHLPPGDIHRLIGQLAAEDDTVYAGGAWGAPLRWEGYMSLITSGYGRRIDPFTGEIRDHTGIDFGVPTGTAIYPVKPGKVIVVERSDTGYGNCVAVSHGDGYASLYAHLSIIYVSVGQTVTTDTALARSGDSGRSSGPHLHFEVIVGGAPENPKKYLP